MAVATSARSFNSAQLSPHRRTRNLERNHRLRGSASDAITASGGLRYARYTSRAIVAGASVTMEGRNWMMRCTILRSVIDRVTSCPVAICLGMRRSAHCTRL